MKPPSGIRAQRTGETGLPGSRPGREGGFILIAVLWLLVALGAVGIHAALAMRTERLAVANVLDETRARQTALAGAEYARSHLTAALLNMADELRAQSAQADDRSGGSRTQSVQAVYRSTDPLNDPWRDPQGLVISQIAYGTSHFSLRLRDSQAALNLNTADEEMLTNFFAQGLELDFAQADRLAQAKSCKMK